MPRFVEVYDTDVYGRMKIYTGPGADGQWFTDDDVPGNVPLCRYLYTGREYDPETGLYYYRARYYSPELGRFISRDPLGYGGGSMGLYEYGAGNPAVNVDPSGEIFGVDDAIIGLAVVAGLALWGASYAASKSSTQTLQHAGNFGMGLVEGFGMAVGTSLALAGIAILSPMFAIGAGVALFAVGASGAYSTYANWGSYSTNQRYHMAGMFVGGIAGARPGRFLATRAAASAQIAGDIIAAPEYVEWVLGGAKGSVPKSTWYAENAATFLRWNRLQVLYRGQDELSSGESFLSPIARGQVAFNGQTGIAASRELAAAAEAEGMNPRDMAAMYGAEPVRGSTLRAGAAGIPFSSRIAVASGYAQGGRLYGTLQVLGGNARVARGWSSFGWEFEHVALHEVLGSTIVRSMKPGRVPFIPPPS
jgi:RHS repeat-associated protein